MRKNILFNVAEYIRLSREDGDKVESDSIGNQRKLINDFLHGKEEFVLYDIYIDDGFTGTNFNRPEFIRMINDIEAGKVNCVIVKDLSRFGRDYIETGKYLERYFPANDIRFISITDNIDSFRQAYDILLPIKNIFNEQYARDISKKVHASMTTKQKAGEFIGAFASYGYKKSTTDKNKLVIDGYAANVVRKIFELYINGCGKIKIASILNETGIACPSEYKKMNGEKYRNCNRLDTTSYWTYSTINHILQNQMYTGKMVQGKTCQYMHGKAKAKDKDEWIIVENTHEAIIDEETWDKAQSLLSRRTRDLDLESNTSIFAGFLKCGDCGRALTKKIRQGNITYYCGSYVRTGRKFCTPHPLPHEVIEKIVLNDLKSIIQSIDNLHEIIQEQIQNCERMNNIHEKEGQYLETELQKIKRLKKSVYEDYKEELISKEEYITYRQEYQKKEDALNNQIAQLQKKQTNQTDTDIYSNPWIKRLLELRDIQELDRQIVVEMIHEIKVYENHKIVITYNFSDELEALLNSDMINTKDIG